MKNITNQPVAKTAVKLEEDYRSFPCLTEVEAQKRLLAEGYNELPSSKRRGVFAIALEVIKEPMFVLLLSCGSIYLLLGSTGEAILLLASIFVIMFITFYQERKTERALEALKDLSSPRALVLRDGKTKRIPGREVARGDVIILSEGDRVPADAAILDTGNFSVNESLLTGESMPTRKTVWDKKTEMGRPGGDDLPFIYSGTLVTQGQAVAQVRSTGTNTEMGKIGKTLQSLHPEQTLLQKEVKGMVKAFAFWGIFLCLAVIISYGIITKQWLDGFLAGIALAMSVLPEEFPVILTVFLALGAWRMSRKNVLTRRIPVIETLGATTVLCVDKTGTLTENRMQIQKLCNITQCLDVTALNSKALPEDFHHLVEFAVLASHKDPFDPMEKAIRNLGQKSLSHTEHWHNNWGLIRQYPLSQHLLAMSQVWVSPEQTDYVIAAKGAPEAIMDLCHMSQQNSAYYLDMVELMAKDGLRVLGVARSKFAQSNLPEDQHDLDFEFLGLLGLLDPVRERVPEAIKECYAAGIRVVMITGDYPTTAEKIAREAGFMAPENILTGMELDKLTDEELQKRINNITVFARTVPEQKLRIVNALKTSGEVVAMTGDGVNDAPALKAAHVGIAMGQRGTDVARESADLVLLDDNFISIVQAVKQGRRIYDNLTKAMAYVLAIHVPIAGMALFPILLKWPLVLLPVQIVFMELIIDPSCSIVFEAEAAEKDIMSRKPRKLTQSLFNTKVVVLSLLQGASILIITLLVYMIALKTSSGAPEARAIAFVALIASNLSLILTNRSWSRPLTSFIQSKNTALMIILTAVPVILGLILYTPSLSSLFQFSRPHLMDIVGALAAGLLSVMWFEIYKLVQYLKQKKI